MPLHPEAWCATKNLRGARHDAGSPANRGIDTAFRSDEEARIADMTDPPSRFAFANPHVDPGGHPGGEPACRIDHRRGSVSFARVDGFDVGLFMVIKLRRRHLHGRPRAGIRRCEPRPFGAAEDCWTADEIEIALVTA